MKKRIAAMVLAGAMALSLAPAYGATEVKAEASKCPSCRSWCQLRN